MPCEGFRECGRLKRRPPCGREQTPVTHKASATCKGLTLPFPLGRLEVFSFGEPKSAWHLLLFRSQHSSSGSRRLWSDLELNSLFCRNSLPATQHEVALCSARARVLKLYGLEH